MAMGLRSSVGIRLVIIGALGLMLLIPALMVQSLIKERQHRRNGVVHEVSKKWGRTQIVSGPIMTVPFKKYYKDKKGNLRYSTHYAHFLPDDLNIEGAMNPEVRYRGIYEVILYNSKLHLAGRFSLANLEELDIPEKNVIWKDASLSMGISDMKGIKEAIKIKWNDLEAAPNPGIKNLDVLSSGVSTRVKLDSRTKVYKFSMDLNLNGSDKLMVAPLGKETRVKLSSTWDTPSFTGEFLPETRDIKEDGFSASWKVLHLNRNYPQQWTDNEGKRNLENSAFGVKLLMPIDEYQKTMRTAKYAVMFIALAFLSFFMMEILNRKDIHPIQYLLVGFALVLFYTLLLSISEHMLFKYAYLIASAAMVALVTAYAKSVLTSTALTGIIAGILSILYGFLYIILQLQDYALLLGSMGLFVILAAVMYLTRKIDWFNVLKQTAG
jgi:inner membrane protein